MVAILILAKNSYKMNISSGQMMTYSSNIEIHDLTIVNIYVAENIASEYTKQKTLDRLEIDQHF